MFGSKKSEEVAGLEKIAEDQFKSEKRQEMVESLKDIKRKTFSAKKLLVSYTREAEAISEKIDRDLAILEDM